MTPVGVERVERVIRQDLAALYVKLRKPSLHDLASAALAAIPDGWAKVDGEWCQITADGVGYGEFDRVPASDESGAR